MANDVFNIISGVQRQGNAVTFFGNYGGSGTPAIYTGRSEVAGSSVNPQTPTLAETQYTNRFMVPSNLANFKNAIIWPDVYVPVGNTNLALAGTGNGAAFIVAASESGSLSNVEFRSGTVTTSGLVNIRVEGINFSGAPNGVLLNAGASTTHIVSTGSIWIVPASFASNVIVTRGQEFAVVFRYSGGGNYNIGGNGNRMNGNNCFPYYLTSTDGTGWIKTDQGAPNLALKYSDGRYANLIGVCPSLTASTTLLPFSGGGTITKWGNNYLMPGDMKVEGISLTTSVAGTGVNFQVKVYDSSYNAISGAVISFSGGRCANAGARIYEKTFPVPFIARGGYSYKVAIEPVSTGNVTPGFNDVDSIASMAACPGGTGVYAIAFSGGNWIDVPRRRISMSLIGGAVSSDRIHGNIS